VSALEALAMFTRHAAFAAFEEDERGSLAPGRRADLTVLDRDPLAVAPAELLQARVLLTLVGGRVVHEAAR
jgi:predicted amidohydrolase YtcJ